MMNFEPFFQNSTSVVQIGAMDGIAFDEFYPYIMQYGNQLTTTLFVEPVPWWFEKLKTNYATFPHFKFENSAISDFDGMVNMVTIPPKNLDQQAVAGFGGCSMIGSKFTNLLPEMPSDMDAEPFKEHITVPTMTFTSLTKKHNIDTIDLLKIDTEGHDWVILSQVDLNVYSPKVIMWEVLHLSTLMVDASAQYCKNHGYQVTCVDSYRGTPSQLVAYK